MKVTFLLPEFTFHPGGGPRVVYEYANGLVARGHEVTVVWRQDVPSDPRGVLRRIRREARNRWTGRSLRRTLQWFRLDPRVQVVTTRWGASDASVARALPAADVLVPTFWTTWGPVAAADPTKGRALQLVQSYETWAASADVIDAMLRTPVPKVVVAPSLEGTLLGLGVDPALITVVPNGVDHDVFRPRSPAADRSPGVAFLASTVPVKRLDLAVAVLEGARQRCPDLVATAFGVEPRPGALPAWVTYVRQPSPEVLAREVLGRAPVFLCTSDHEGWGLPAVEAMSCGCALVSTRNGGVENFAVDHESALLCAVGDGAGLTDAVVRLLDDLDTRAAISRGALSATASMSWERSVEGFERAALAALAG